MVYDKIPETVNLQRKDLLCLTDLHGLVHGWLAPRRGSAPWRSARASVPSKRPIGPQSFGLICFLATRGSFAWSDANAKSYPRLPAEVARKDPLLRCLCCPHLGFQAFGTIREYITVGFRI